jgi:hypothetical protein
MISSTLSITLFMAALVIGIGSTAIISSTRAQEGNTTGSVVVADEDNQVTIVGQQGPPGPSGVGTPGADGAPGLAGSNGTNGKDGIVSFKCFDLNNVQVNCPFVSVPVVTPTPEPEVPPVVANETGNVTAPVTNETTGEIPANDTGVIPTETEPVVNETAPIVVGGLDTNGTIVLGGEPVPAENTTTTTTTTNTTVTTDANGTTTTNSTSETVPADLNFLSQLIPNFGI